MPTAPTAVMSIARTATARVTAGTTRIPGPPPLETSDAPEYLFVVANHLQVRAGMLTTARFTSSPEWPLSGPATAVVQYQADDPNAAVLRLDDGRVATTETADVELHVYRDGALLPAHWCITKASPDPVTGTVTLSLLDTSWYLQQRRLGYAQMKNFLDLAHWDGQEPRDGWFDAALSGWGEFHGATKEHVTDPQIDLFAPHTAKVTAPGSPRDDGMGIAKFCDCSHDFAGGLRYRFQARNWHPSDQPEFYFEVALELRYYPPGSTDYTARNTFFFDPTTHARDTWNTWHVDLHVPANAGGRLRAIMQCPESGHTFWGSRWSVIRNETFGPVRPGGDLPAPAIARVVEIATKLPGDFPYRNLHGDGSSLSGRRVKFRYPDVEHHSPYDVIQQVAQKGGVHWWWDVTPTRRTLASGDRIRTRWDWPVTLDGPAGFAQSWEADASQARNRVVMQGTQADFSRDQVAVITPDRPGAVIDEILTANANLQPAELYMAGLDRIAWREHTPDLITASLPGDAVHSIHVGDIHPVALDVGAYSLESPLLRSVSLRLDTDNDRVLLQMVPWAPPESFGA